MANPLRGGRGSGPPRRPAGLPLLRPGDRRSNGSTTTAPSPSPTARPNSSSARPSARPSPHDGFLGEEYGDTPGSSGFRWVLDPIDGTRNFVRGIPIWATLVGLEYKGEQIAGVAEAPALRMTWRALRGDGAYRGDRRIRVSDVARSFEVNAVLLQPVVVPQGGTAGRLPGADAEDGPAARLRRFLRSRPRRGGGRRGHGGTRRPCLGHRRAQADRRGGRRPHHRLGRPAATSTGPT